MLDQALAKHCYDELCCSDLIGFLQARPAAFDLAAASGVFILFGDLAPLFGSLYAALRGGGQVVFTAYRAVNDDVEVRHNLHFAHRPEYLRRVAADSGFEIDALTDCVHEFEHGVAQPGLLVVMRRT
jgi:predicted TPR repeat methyltransferase